jgi:hypothetical protein
LASQPSLPAWQKPEQSAELALSPQAHGELGMQPIDLLAHFSNLLMLVSYSLRGMLWLRWFAVASAITIVPYYVVQSTTLWPPIYWACVFTAINLL